VLVDRVNARTPIRDQYDCLGSFDGLDDLLSHLSIERSFRDIADASRIDEQEIPSSPFRVGELPIARHPTPFGHDGDASAHDTIE
jgi:hypothetical protein